MSQNLLRPRFEVRVPWDADAVVRRIQERLARPDSPCWGMVAELQRVIDLRMRPEQKHLWSPALGLQIEPDEETGGAVVHALLGPEPAVWTGIAFAYVGLFTGLAFLLTLGAVQWSLGYTMWAFWLAGLLVAGVVGVWAVARVGRRLAAPQTVVLRHFLEEVLDLPREERVRTDQDPYHE